MCDMGTRQQQDFITALEQAKDAQCVGCGYCCRQMQCYLSLEVYGTDTGCPGLIYDFEEKRYYCELCRKPGELGEKYRKALSIGAGCSSPLFNTDRENIPLPAISRAVSEGEKDA